MQTTKFIAVMFEELQTEYRNYLRLRHEFERIHAVKELARKRAELLKDALDNEEFRQGADVDPFFVQARDLLCRRS